MNGLGQAMFVLVTAYTGLLIYSHYALCDPLKSGQILSKDQVRRIYTPITYHRSCVEG